MGERGKAGGRRWWRRISWLAVAVLLGAVPVANLALMIPGVKSRVEAKLSALAGSELTTGSIRYWPWSGVVMRDVEVAEGGRMPGVVSVGELVVAAAPWSIFADDIELPLVRVTRPVLALEWKKVAPVVVAAVENREQRRPGEATPVGEAVEERAGGKAMPAEAEAQEAATGREAMAATGKQGQPPAGQERRGRRLVLGEVEVVDGSLALAVPGIEGDVLTGGGIELTVDFSSEAGGAGDGGVIGDLVVGALELGGRVAIGESRGQVWTDGAALRLKEMEVPLGGGVVRVEAAVVPSAGGLPFELSLGAEAVDLAEVSGEGFEGFSFRGVLEGALDLKGYGTVPNSWRGQGGFKIAELGVSGGGTDVVLIPTEVSGRLQGGWAQLEQFYAHSDELALRASGGVVLDGRLGVNLRVYIDQAIAQAVGKKLEVLGGGQPSGMRTLEGTHYVFRDVAVRGSLSDPRLVLWEGYHAVRPGDFLRCFTPEEGGVVEPFVAQ